MSCLKTDIELQFPSSLHHGIMREDWGIGVGRAGAREVGEGRTGGEAAELKEYSTTMLNISPSKQS